MKNSERNGTIDFFKFIFFVMIMIYHGRILEPDRDNWIFCDGFIGVEFFFMVSGYMMAKHCPPPQSKCAW